MGIFLWGVLFLLIYACAIASPTILSISDKSFAEPFPERILLWELTPYVNWIDLGTQNKVIWKYLPFNSQIGHCIFWIERLIKYNCGPYFHINWEQEKHVEQSSKFKILSNFFLEVIFSVFHLYLVSFFTSRSPRTY